MIPRPIPVFARVAAIGALLLACTAAPGTAPTPAASAAAGGCPTAQPAALAAGESRVVTIATELGSMTLTIEADLSPIAAGNFVTLAGCGFYDGVVFHRVVPGFVIQGGDPTGTGTGGPGYTIKDEPVTTPYSRGTVAMARTPAPDSVGSQFFIVLDDEARTALESANTYQIIGTVTAGMETAEAIVVAANGVELPSDPVVMTDVSVAP
ncbi:MAG TPA: peptidylprolyl isomerase [Candidatus Limnocylindrales bacterium]|jgi:cyclophilin family peptidyl-prolyl cis-trans isomerase|nr:peptidylprolyl isomerase [Candidatus Limnocylindrales bacterium]